MKMFCKFFPLDRPRALLYKTRIEAVKSRNGEAEGEKYMMY